MLAVWYGGHRHGLILSFFSAAVWLAAEVGVGHEYSHFLTLAWNTVVRLMFFWLIMELLLSVRDKMATLTSLASSDPLTGLANSRFFLEQLEREHSRVRRYPELFTIAYLDRDNFKYVNDTLGHVIGDELLQRVGEVLKSNLRESDMAARLGGDEFVVFFPAMEESASKQVLEKLQRSLIAAMAERRWPVTFSIGVVTYHEAPSNIRKMVKIADDLMYRVKKSGKNNIAYITYPTE